MSKLSMKTVGAWLFVLGCVCACFLVAISAVIDLVSNKNREKSGVVEVERSHATSGSLASASPPATVSKPRPAASVPNIPDSRRSKDSNTETITHWDSVGRFSFEYPAAWRIVEGQEQIILSSSESNECTVELDFHSWGSVVDPRGYGFEDTAQGACQVYMKDAITNGRPTNGPTKLQMAGADDAAWAAWEWNNAITELVIFRAGGLFKKFQLHYASTATEFRSEALIPLQTLRINSRHPQLAMNPTVVGNSPKPTQALPQTGAAEEGYVAPSPAFSKLPPSTVSGGVGNPRTRLDAKTLRAQRELSSKAEPETTIEQTPGGTTTGTPGPKIYFSPEKNPEQAPAGTVPKTGEERFDHLFADKIDLAGGKTNLTQEYAKRYPDKEKDTVTFAEFIEKQPIVTSLPKVDKASIQTRETTQISLAQYMDSAGDLVRYRIKLVSTLLSRTFRRAGMLTALRRWPSVSRIFAESS